MFNGVIVTLFITITFALPLQCYPKNFVKGKRIVNGLQASEGQFPWQAGLFLTNAFGRWFCGGAIIGPEWILTSANCVYGAEEAQVLTGSIELNGNNGSISTANEFVLHENHSLSSHHNDIGLVKLQDLLTFDANTNSVDIAKIDVELGTKVTVSGWGATSQSDLTLSPFLNYVTLDAIGNDECAFSYGANNIYDEMVCANLIMNLARGPCDGDTGGPLISGLDTIPLLVGVSSFFSPIGCESGNPYGFTRTVPYKTWIQEKTGLI